MSDKNYAMLPTDPNLINPLSLAFLGDAVYSTLTRERLVAMGIHPSKLHPLSLKLVSAPSQAAGFAAIESLLTQQELAVFKRGRNVHTAHVPKNATIGEYHTATGLECLFGWLYLQGETDRMSALFHGVWTANFGNTSPAGIAE